MSCYGICLFIPFSSSSVLIGWWVRWPQQAEPPLLGSYYVTMKTLFEISTSSYFAQQDLVSLISQTSHSCWSENRGYASNLTFSFLALFQCLTKRYGNEGKRDKQVTASANLIFRWSKRRCGACCQDIRHAWTNHLRCRDWPGLQWHHSLHKCLNITDM